MDKVKILDFIINKGCDYTRKSLGRIIEDQFGEEEYRYYRNLWKGRYLKYNMWGLVTLTRRGWDLERELKGWDK